MMYLCPKAALTETLFELLKSYDLIVKFPLQNPALTCVTSRNPIPEHLNQVGSSIRQTQHTQLAQGLVSKFVWWGGEGHIDIGVMVRTLNPRFLTL